MPRKVHRKGHFWYCDVVVHVQNGLGKGSLDVVSTKTYCRQLTENCNINLLFVDN